MYGVIATTYVLSMVWSDRAREILGEKLFAFSVTLVAGMMLILILLAIQLYTLKKSTNKLSASSGLSCPDYWELTPLTETEKKGIDPEILPYMNFKCTPRTDVFESSSVEKVIVPTPIATDSLQLKALKEAAAKTSTTPAGALSCTNLYPDLLAYTDAKLKKANNLTTDNGVRCEYLATCGPKFAWSSVCP